MIHPRESNDPYYDLFEDWGLIVSSFLSQYGIRLQTREFESVTWDEFTALLGGIAPETALGRIVAIRAETDKDVIKNFSKSQKQIYEKWRSGKAKKISPQAYEHEMHALEKMFEQLCL